MARTKEKNPSVTRLVNAMYKARMALKRFREERVMAVREYVGHHWSEEGTEHTVPVNLLSMYVQIVGRNLISKNPRALMSTFERSAKPSVAAMQSWANTEIEQMNYVDRAREIETDALFTLGIGKVCLATPAAASMAGWNLRAGESYFGAIDFDDFVFDVHARKFDEVGYIGHRYRVLRDVVESDQSYSKQRKDLPTSYDPPFNAQGDERINILGRTYYSVNSEEYDDYVDLWEIYLPHHRLVLTLADDCMTGATEYDSEPLKEQKYIGPDRPLGYYHLRQHLTVPGNAMPKAPIQDLIDNHDSYNNGQRKLMREMRDYKQIIGVMGGQTEDGERLKKADDGDIIPMTDPKSTQMFKFGGPSPELMGMTESVRSLFSWQAGNLDALGGLSSQSKTLGQDKMLTENSSKMIADMQDSAVTYHAGVIKALAWYWWHDPFKVIRTPYSVPGLPEAQIMREVLPEQRQMVPWEKLDVRIDPYSLQHKTPEQKMASIDAVVAQLIPVLPLMQQSGIGIDWQALIRKKAEYLDLTDLPEILMTQEPPVQGDAGDGGGMPAPGSPKPPSTTRNYVRESQPSGDNGVGPMSPRKAMQSIPSNGQSMNGTH